MNRFAELLDRLAYEPARNAKLRLMTDYFRSTTDPERGWALAALTGALSFPHAKSGLDPQSDRRAHRPGAVRSVLRLCRRPLRNRRADVAGADSAPSPRGTSGDPPDNLRSTDGRSKRSRSARQSRTAGAAGALARRARRDRPLGADQAGHRRIAHRRFGAARQRPRSPRSAAEPTRRTSSCSGRASRRPTSTCSPGSKAAPKSRRAAIRRRSGRRCWRTRSTSPISPALDPADFMAEWKWDGIRVQAVAAPQTAGMLARLYSRTGEDISAAFPT